MLCMSFLSLCVFVVSVLSVCPCCLCTIMCSFLFQVDEAHTVVKVYLFAILCHLISSPSLLLSLSFSVVSVLCVLFQVKEAQQLRYVYCALKISLLSISSPSLLLFSLLVLGQISSKRSYQGMKHLHFYPGCSSSRIIFLVEGLML